MGTGHTTSILRRSDEAARKPLQILHLERRREDSQLVRHALEAEGLACEILRVESREEFLAALKECRVELVVADYFEPSLDGLTLLHRVGEQATEPPVIFFVADLGCELAEQALRAGAAAVVLKSQAPRLAGAVCEALAQAEARAGKIHAETRLGETERRLRKIAAGLGQSFWSVTADTDEFHFVSPEFEKLLALPRHHLGSQRFKLLEFVHNDDRELVAGALGEQARMGECQVEFRLAHPDGSARWVWARIFPVLEQGAVVRLAGITEDITGRKSQAKPQDTNDRWAAAFRVFPDLFFLLDSDGMILDFQAGDVSDLLQRPDEFLGRRIQEMGPAGVRAQFAEALERTQRSGAGTTFEYALPVAGLRQHFEARCLPLPDRRMGAFIRNITARKESEAALRESQRRISTLIDTLPGIVFSCANDGEGSLTYLSEGVLQVTGYRREELLRAGGALFRSLIQRDDWLKARDTIQAALRGRQAYFVEYRLRHRAGGERWLWEKGRGLYDNRGELLGREGFITDITDRKQMEQALRDSEVLYHSLVENLPVFLFRKDTEGRITFVNERFCQLTGRPMSGVVGRTDEELFPTALAAVYRAGDQQVMRTRLPLEAEEDQVAADGRPLRIQVIKSPILDAKGNVAGVQGLFWDVTARHDAEQQLRESNQRLEATLRDLKHAQRQVVQQERLHALGQMSSGIAHDFNNTLMAILGFTELLLHPETLDNKPKLISYLKTMSTAAQDAAVVVKRLNDFYRHREEGVVFPPADVAKLVQQVITLTQPKWKDQALASGVHIEVETDLRTVPPVAGHEGELRECLINILFNAVDAMPNGGTIRVATRVEGGAVVLELADTGGGMTEEVRKRCFEPFFSTKGQRGTGLGLSMVFGIIQRHQGTIDVQSEPGRGATFIIRLPALQPGSGDQGDTKVLGRPTRPLSVLVVDDEPLIRQILAEYLGVDGHQVVTAADGREALQRFAEKQFDLILTDRSMPHMSGDKLAEAVKQVDPLKPVVLLTGFGDMMKATGQKPQGVDVVMAKPITLDGLRLSLAEAMGRN